MTEFAVVGAGPVGLYIGCLLAAAGRDVAVLDEGKRSAGTRSIGIHPPALEALDQTGAAEEMVAAGRRIERARLLLEAQHIGDLSLESCPAPYRFVLTLPQGQTERILCQRLERLRPGALRRGVRVVGVRRAAKDMELAIDDGEAFRCRFVIGCDGRLSRVRESLRVPVEGGALNHHYLMADLPEDGSLGEDAAISLGRDGVVESFPLPGGRRRWVARFAKRPEGLSGKDLADVVRKRTGIAVDAGEASASAFTAEKRIAPRLTGDGWALAGDAAHVISPIGGQGMNLGLLGARDLVIALLGQDRERALYEYDRRQRVRARAAARRADVNMLLGSDRLPRGVKWTALRTVLLPALQPRFARYFTMRRL